MGGIVRGDPTRLEAFTGDVQASLDLVRGGIADYATAVASYNAAAPNDLGCVVEDRSAHLEADLGILVDVGRGPAAFAAALRALDTSAEPGVVLSADAGAFARELRGFGDSGGLPSWLTPFFLGDVANFWSGGEDGFPVGSLGAAGIRMLRVRKWMAAAALFGRSSAEAAAVFPTFNTGMVGRGVTALGSRVPWQPVTRGATWLQTPAATTAFTRVGVAGGVLGTATGTYDLIQQGNPVEAYRRDGAGYVADVASTAFSASSTAFFLAPSPVTGGLVIASGIVWAGAEIVDNWDSISGFVGDAASTLADVGGSVVSGVADVGGSVVSGALGLVGW